LTALIKTTVHTITAKKETVDETELK